LRRASKVLIGVVIVVAVLLAANTIALNNETKPAEVTVDGGEVLELSGGDVQVADDGPTSGGSGDPPIVLVHCYACSLQWWDRLVPRLAEEHRVIRLDLLGHGGSEKPKSGYSMEDQAALLAEALNRLGVEGAVVVGHSLGATVAAALAEQSSELVDRVVDIDQAPDNSFGSPPFLARLGYVPVLGQLLDRITPNFAIKDAYQEAFAPGYDVDAGFDNPDQVVDDFNAMTYTSYEESSSEEDSYADEIPLDERLTSAAVPVLLIFGADDQIYDADESVAAFEDVPGIETKVIEDAGHSPNVEQPAQTARLILDFAEAAVTASTAKRKQGKAKPRQRKPGGDKQKGG
jgi:pimeloyl-ACP methyl ester carboxylesterase